MTGFSFVFPFQAFPFGIGLSIFKAKAEADTPNEICMHRLAVISETYRIMAAPAMLWLFFQYTKSISFIWSSPVFISFVSSMARLTASSSLCQAGGSSRSAMSSVDLEKARFAGTAHRLEAVDTA